MLFFYGLQMHQPKIVDVDGCLSKEVANGTVSSKRGKRNVLVRTVEALQDFVIEDATCGSFIEGVFVKMPGKTGCGKKTKNLYSCIKRMEARRRGSKCRSNNEGYRIAVCDGEDSSYNVFGMRVNRRKGNGVYFVEDELLVDPVFKAWMKEVTHKCNEFLPLHVRRLIEAIKKYCDEGCGTQI